MAVADWEVHRRASTSGFKTLKNAGNPFQTFHCQASTVASALSDVLTTDTFRDRYLLSSLLSKLGTEAVSDEQREQAAIDSWYADERHNRKTTIRLQKYWRGEFHDKCILGVPVRSLLGVAADLIASVLPKWDHAFYERSAFTNGASVGYGKRVGDPVYKYDGKLTVTPLAYSRVVALVNATPTWRDHLISLKGDVVKHVRIVPGEHGFTVAKNAETDRYCSKQATGNMLLQKAHGNVIRDALLTVGIDLNDQSRNRNAARRASRHGRDATIDLKSASNSVTCLLVSILLPSDWVNEIMVARSPLCKPRRSDPWVKTEMVGAMGNGFTFELESLIFWALAEACRICTRSSGRTLVYGDDVVAPTKCIHHVMALYGFCGLRINPDKSFWSGKFRESCGGHFYEGNDVTPIYIRKPITDTTRMIWFLNKLRSWAGGESADICDDRVWPLYKRLRRKFVCATLWGGVRSNSITSLWGPGPRRTRLCFGIRTREISVLPLYCGRSNICPTTP